MFHRVKSEGPEQTSQTPKQPEARKDIKPEASPFKPLQPAASEQVVVPPVSVAPAAPVPQANPFSARPSEVQVEASKEIPSQPVVTNSPAKDVPSMNSTDNSNTDSSYNDERDLPISTFARTGAAPAVRSPMSAYPGSYSAYNSRPQEQSSASSSDRRLTIGSGITLSGEIESCDYLLVEGTVEAALKGANVLDIAESGVFYGTVEINEATIAGRFEGDISVNGRLTITSTGVVTGSISYKELSIEAGAVIDGKLTPFSAVAATGKKPLTGANKASKPAPKSDNSYEVGGSEGELFSKTAAAAE